MLTRSDLLSLEDYDKVRPTFKVEVMEHKANRRVPVNKNITFYFEDELTIKYQIQEMLRIEKTFDEEGIQAELDAYTPLIPGGADLKATMMIEYGDPEVRKKELHKLAQVEKHIYFLFEGDDRPYCVIANEDLERSSKIKTSAVHFLRFPFTEEQVEKFIAGDKFTIRISHNQLYSEVTLTEAQQRALAKDLKVKVTS
jgi:hypothetical protein